MNQISKSKEYQITSICYANVIGLFLTFLKRENRGENFYWEDFSNICENWADIWMDQNDIKGNKSRVNEFAKQTTREIAERIIRQAKSKGIIL